MVFHKVQIEYKYCKKRNFNLITPCCNKSNNDGKFSTFVGLPEIYGYCHSCGETSLPPTLFKDDKGNEYIWNELQNKYEPLNQLQDSIAIMLKHSVAIVEKPIKYIDEAVIWRYYHISPENNLLQYLRKTYCNDKVEEVKKLYAIGTSADGGTIFWNINSALKVQKAKISYYNENGKRTNHFKVPYENEDGYYACLFGEHLVYDFIGNRFIILVESEKTAIVGHIHFPEYIWVAYGGSNGLTDNKLKPLIGYRVLIIPDMSETAVNIIYEKLPLLISMGIDAKIWDMTEGKTDEELKNEGIYNNDLEDLFRKFVLNISESI
jgi:hypothetical protein